MSDLETIDNLLREVSKQVWDEVTRQRIKRCEMLLRVTKHSLSRKKILQELKWLQNR